MGDFTGEGTLRKKFWQWAFNPVKKLYFAVGVCFVERAENAVTLTQEDPAYNFIL